MNKLKFFGISLVTLSILALSFYVLCLNHVSVNEIGIAYNSRTGDLTIQNHAGWYITSPLVKTTTLSMLPQVVHIPSNARVINTKIVRLKPEFILDFIKLQGFSYELNSCLNYTLMGYAFSGQNYTFLEIVQQGGTELPVK